MRGEHGLLGKFHLYEGSAGVPLIMAGPDVPEGLVVDEPVSHVDLHPTILEAFGAATPDPPPNAFSLWPVMEGARRPAPVFAEYHAAGSKAGSFMLRSGHEKLIYDVGSPPQLFDLAADPGETRDLAATREGCGRTAALERQLRAICDPEAVDRRAKADQRAKIDFWGGVDAVRKEGLLVYTPAPGTSAEIEKTP
jgi:choline-sulfatase